VVQRHHHLDHPCHARLGLSVPDVRLQRPQARPGPPTPRSALEEDPRDSPRRRPGPRPPRTTTRAGRHRRRPALPARRPSPAHPTPPSLWSEEVVQRDRPRSPTCPPSRQEQPRSPPELADTGLWETPPTGCEISSPEKTNPRSGPVTRLPCPPPDAEPTPNGHASSPSTASPDQTGRPGQTTRPCPNSGAGATSIQRLDSCIQEIDFPDCNLGARLVGPQSGGRLRDLCSRVGTLHPLLRTVRHRHPFGTGRDQAPGPHGPGRPSARPAYGTGRTSTTCRSPRTATSGARPTR
jgi:hypothetical protein